MFRSKTNFILYCLLVCCANPLMAQKTATANSVVPSVIKFIGTLSGVDGKPLTGTVRVTLLLYKEQTGGAPLYLETQNVAADKNGHYSVTLGSASAHGLPPDLFLDGEARWLAVEPAGEQEGARIALMSVPYALKAADAETLGGRPASSFILAAPGGGKTPEGPEVANPIACSSGTACQSGHLPVFSTNGGSAQVGSSILTQNGTTATIEGDVNVQGYVVANNGLTGFSGTTNSAVDGDNTGSGPGVYARSTLGPAFVGNGDALQSRVNGGWIKAMAYVSGFNGTAVYYCFNSTIYGSGARQAPCGFKSFRAAPNTYGDYVIDFGFEVDDRVFCVTPSVYNIVAKVCTVTNGGWCPNTSSLTKSQIEVTFLDSNQDQVDNKFYVVVF